MVDTGASLVILRYEDARALGLVYGSDKFDVAVQTANGTAKALRVKLYSVRLGSISLDDIDALVMEEGLFEQQPPRHELPAPAFALRSARRHARSGTLTASPR